MTDREHQLHDTDPERTPAHPSASAASGEIAAPNKGDYVLATKYEDGEAWDWWGLGWFDRIEHGRFMVVDSEGKQTRGNGYRRCRRISRECGNWLWAQREELERTGAKLWDLVASFGRKEAQPSGDDAAWSELVTACRSTEDAGGGLLMVSGPSRRVVLAKDAEIAALRARLAEADDARMKWRDKAQDVEAERDQLKALIAAVRPSPTDDQVPAGLPPGHYSITLTEAAIDVLGERARQIRDEGWTAIRDDNYTDGELARAASCYAMPITMRLLERPGYSGTPIGWPWLPGWWKPTDRRRDLVKAGALIVAELERMDRAAAKAMKS